MSIVWLGGVEEIEFEVLEQVIAIGDEG